MLDEFGHYSEFGGTVISIGLKPGLYTMGFKSGAGKTYLTNAIRKSMPHDDRVYAYTYSEVDKSDFRLVWNNMTEEQKEDLEVMVFDRFDRYGEAYIPLLKELSDRYIILLDCKDSIGKIGGNFCDVDFYTEDDNYCIEVT